jgi:NADH-quinone oxidoreductase subunit M
MNHLLTIVTFLPLLGAIILLFLPKDASRTHGLLAMVVTLLTLAVSIPLYFLYHPEGNQFQLRDYAPWAPAVGINYFLGIDGISLLMVLMTTVIFPFVVGVSLKSTQDRTQMFYFLILFVESAILGVFMSLNLVLFYIFYEAMLIPLYFIVGMWGGERRIYATLKFFLYTMVGSVLMLASIISIFFMVQTFDLPQVQALLPAALAKFGDHALAVEMLLFLGFFAAFAVKAPIWPLHTWVPDAYTEAPIAGSIILVALKMGLYGFIRFNLPLFPHATAAAAPVIVTLAVIGVVYSALVAAAQTDLKRLIAYSSISHVGVVALAIFGLTAIGISGGVIQMVNHTITTGALFILVGLLFARRGTYEISAYGGVWKVMPVFTAIFLLVTLSSVALPGTGGFTGEFLMLLGAFQTHPWAAGIATTAAIWSVVYMLWMFQRVFFGANDKPEVQSMPDITLGDKWALVPLVLLFLWLGIFPNPLLNKVNQPTVTVLSQMSAQTGTPVIPTTPIPDNMGPRPAPVSAARLPAQSTRLAQR